MAESVQLGLVLLGGLAIGWLIVRIESAYKAYKRGRRG